MLENNAENDPTRCQAVTALLLTQWQAKGAWPAGYTPSFLLVNAGEGPDPCMSAIRALHASDLPSREAPMTGVARSQDAEHAEKMMHALASQNLAVPPTNSFEKSQSDAIFKRWVEYQKVFYKSTSTAFYGREHPRYGFAWNSRHHVNLFVESTREVFKLKQNIGDKASTFWNPWCSVPGEKKKPMSSSILGSISSDLWTSQLVGDVIAKDAPILFLPHSPVPAVELPNSKDLVRVSGFDTLADKTPVCGMIVPDPHCLPVSLELYEVILRCRLLHYPSHYAYYVQSLLRLVYTRVNLLVTKLMVTHTTDSDEWRYKLEIMTYETVVRGVTFGIEAMIYHCYGLPLVGEQRTLANKILTFIRERGICTRREISRRFQSIDKAERDQLLVLFSRESLIILNDTEIQSVSCRDFISFLPQRRFMPKPLTWNQIPFSLS